MLAARSPLSPSRHPILARQGRAEGCVGERDALHASIVGAKENRALKPSPWRKSIGGTPLEIARTAHAVPAPMAGTPPMQRALSRVLKARELTTSEGSGSDGNWSD